MKDLSTMTREELWQLFPIFLTAHNPAWAAWYREEALPLAQALPGAAVHHVGSTAVEGLWAKAIVDILVIVPEADFPAAEKAILRLGYRAMSREPGRVSFNKGYTPAGFADRVFHLHLRCPGDNAELYFRDYLRAHPDVAADYQALKLALWKRFEHDRDAYTLSKTDFIRRATARAREEFPRRYD